jgi:hypothetical protein
LTEEDIDRMIANDPDLYRLTGEELSQFELVKGANHEKKIGDATRITLAEAKRTLSCTNFAKIKSEQKKEKAKIQEKSGPKSR